MSEHDKARQGLITATDIAALAHGGASTWYRIKQTKITGESGFKGNKFTEWGKEREKYIASHVELLWDVKPNTEIIIKDGTNHAATPDGLSNEMTGEYKTTVIDWDLVVGADLKAVKPSYYDQVQWAMYVTGRKCCIFAWEYHQNFQPANLTTISVQRDDERIDELLEVAEKFSYYLLEPEEPSEFDTLMAQYSDASAWLSEAQAAVDEVKERILTKIGDRDKVSAKTPFGTLSYFTGSARKTFSKEMLAEAHPEIDLEKFMKLGAVPKPTLKVSI